MDNIPCDTQEQHAEQCREALSFTKGGWERKLNRLPFQGWGYPMIWVRVEEEDGEGGGGGGRGMGRDLGVSGKK
jgi:hypothetical protein